MVNWKTSLAGYILAGFIAAQPFFDGGFDAAKDWPQLVIAVGIAVFAAVTKDNDTTGAGATAKKVD